VASDLNAKHPFWNSAASYTSEQKRSHLFNANDFEILVHIIQHYSPAGNSDVLDIVVQKNIGPSHVVSYILDSDHLPTVFHILYYVTTNQLMEPLKKFTEWEQFQNLASNFISPRTEINSGIEADKVAQKFTASIALAYRFSKSKARTFGTKSQSSWF
jgi:hypothetical protein